MRLFFKHIARTVRLSPLQPILIFLTVILSVAVGVTSFRLGGVFFERSEDIKNEPKELGDITVTASADRDLGIIFDNDAREILGDKAEVVGAFELMALLPSRNGSSIAYAAAVDLEAADEYFLFDYYGYGNITDENLQSSVVISKRFADEMKLKVGDSITISLLNEKLDMTVQAIAENNGLLDKKDILVPMERVLRLLSGKSSFIASLGSDFMPYNKLMIRCADGVDAVEIFELLSKHEKMQGCNVVLTAEGNIVSPFAMFQTIAVSLLAFVLLLLSLMLMLTSQSLLRKQRTLEYAQFAAVGASGTQLTVMQLLENLIYAILGATIGILISPQMLKYAINMFEWYEYEPDVGVSGILFGYGIAIILAVSVTVISAKKDGKTELALKLNESNYPHAPALSIIPLLVTGSVFLAGTVIAMLMPIAYRYCVLLISTVSFVFLIYFVAPYFYKWLMGLTDKAIGRGKRIPGLFAIAVKSIKNSFALRHTGRLLCVVISLFVSITVSANVFSNQYKVLDEMISGEIMTANLNDRIKSELLRSESVDGIAKFECGTVILNGYLSVMCINVAGDAEKCASDVFLPDTLPGAGEVAISFGVARLMDIGVGDTVRIDIRGKNKEMTVSCIWKVNVAAVYVGEPFTSSSTVNINLVDGADDSTYRETVALLESYGVGVVDNKDIIGIMDTLGGFDALIEAVVLMAAILSFIGLTNVISECLRSRKNERKLLIQSGLEPRKTAVLHIYEIGTVSLIALMIGLIGGAAIAMMLHYLVHSFGYTLFYF